MLAAVPGEIPITLPDKLPANKVHLLQLLSPNCWLCTAANTSLCNIILFRLRAPMKAHAWGPSHACPI